VEHGGYISTIVANLQGSATGRQHHVQLTMQVIILLKLLLRNMNKVRWLSCEIILKKVSRTNKENISMSNSSTILGKNLITTHFWGFYFNFGAKFGRKNNEMVTNEGSILFDNAYLKESGTEILPSLSRTWKFQFPHTSTTHLASSVVLKTKKALYLPLSSAISLPLSNIFQQFQQIYYC